MKKIIYSLITGLFFACSNDGSDSGSAEQKVLIGKWTPETEKEYSSSNVLTNEYNLSQEECYHMTTYEFKPTNKFVKDSYDYDGHNCVQNSLHTYNYTYSNNIIVIDQSESFIVLENTTSKLKLKSIDDDNSYTIIEYSKVN